MDTRRAAHRFYDAVNQAMTSGDMAVFDEVLAPNVVDHNPTPGMAPGRDGIRRAFAELRAAFPDYHATVEDVIVEGNKAACRITGRLIYAGREVSLHGIDILQFDGDVLVARWGQFEPLPA